MGGEVAIGQIAENGQEFVTALLVGIERVMLGVTHFAIAAHELRPQLPVLLREGQPDLLEKDQLFKGAGARPFVGFGVVVQDRNCLGVAVLVNNPRVAKKGFLGIERPKIDGRFPAIDARPSAHLVVVTQFVINAPSGGAIDGYLWDANLPRIIVHRREAGMAPACRNLNVFHMAVLALRRLVGQRSVITQARQSIVIAYHLGVVGGDILNIGIAYRADLAGGNMDNRQIAFDFSIGCADGAPGQPLCFGRHAAFEVGRLHRIGNFHGDRLVDRRIGDQDHRPAIR